jgi:hypothetical protein
MWRTIEIDSTIPWVEGWWMDGKGALVGGGVVKKEGRKQRSLRPPEKGRRRKSVW